MLRFIRSLSLVKRIRMEAGAWAVGRMLRDSKRSGRSIRLSEAKSIGIVFNVNSEQTPKHVKAFMEQLRASGVKHVRALGFCPVAAHLAHYKPVDTIGFYYPDHLGWDYLPTGHEVGSFVNEPFDMLIDLRANRSLAQLWIPVKSKAVFKVGRFSERFTVCFDLMIDMGKDERTSELTRQVMHYLTMMDKDN